MFIKKKFKKTFCSPCLQSGHRDGRQCRHNAWYIAYRVETWIDQSEDEDEWTSEPIKPTYKVTVICLSAIIVRNFMIDACVSILRIFRVRLCKLNLI